MIVKSSCCELSSWVW